MNDPETVKDLVDLIPNVGDSFNFGNGWTATMQGRWSPDAPAADDYVTVAKVDLIELAARLEEAIADGDLTWVGEIVTQLRQLGGAK